MAEPLRLGIVGAGAIVQVGHLPALKRMKDVVVAGICDNDLPKARALADRFGIPVAFDDMADLIASAELDAILVCTPNHLHESHITAALGAGLHVFAERPLALTSAGAQKLVKLAQRRDRVVMIGANHRYRPDVQLIRSFIQSGEMGDVESLRTWWFVSRAGRTSLGWRQKRELSGGGAMMDLGLGLLDLSLWLLGFPEQQRVSAVLPESRSGRGVEPSGIALIALAGGASIHLDVSWRFVGPGERMGLALRSSKGSARINPLAIWKDFHGVAQDVATHGAQSRESPFSLGVRAQWAHFVAAVRGEAPRPDLSEQVTVLSVMEAIYASANDGHDVTP